LDYDVDSGDKTCLFYRPLAKPRGFCGFTAHTLLGINVEIILCKADDKLATLLHYRCYFDII